MAVNEGNGASTRQFETSFVLDLPEDKVRSPDLCSWTFKHTDASFLPTCTTSAT